MTPAERRFKLALVEVILDGQYPSPANVYRQLGRGVRPHRDMNGRECRWREEVFYVLGWRRVPYISVNVPLRRWAPPGRVA